MPSSPKEIINIDLNQQKPGIQNQNPVVPSEPIKADQTPQPVAQSAPAPQPMAQQPTPQVAPAMTPQPTASVQPPLPPIDGEHLHPGVISTPISKSQMFKNTFKNMIAKKNIETEPNLDQKATMIKQLENPDEEGYLYNKATIGGIDQSKLEYKETFKPKITFQKPTHKYSWVILGIFLVLGTSLGIGYYQYHDILSNLIASIPGISKVQPEPKPNPIVVNNPNQQGLREELMQIKPPFLLENDPLLKQFRAITVNTDLNGEQVGALLSENILSQITSEFFQVKAIVDSRSQIKDPNPAATPNNGQPNGQTNQTVPSEQTSTQDNPANQRIDPANLPNDTNNNNNSTAPNPAMQNQLQQIQDQQSSDTQQEENSMTPVEEAP